MVPPTLNTFPMKLCKRVKYCSKNFSFFCCSGLRNFFRHPYYMVPPTLNTFPMKLCKRVKYFSKNFSFFAALDLENFSVIHTIWFPDIKHLSHAPISMKLCTRVLHIISQAPFSRILDSQNIFQKLFFIYYIFLQFVSIQ